MSLYCPHCGDWRAECEDLPKEQEEWKPIRCGKCEKIFAIRWQVVHSASTLEDRSSMIFNSKDFLKELTEI